MTVGVLLAGAAGFFWMRGCAAVLPAIEVDAGIIHVRNNTPVEWRDVRIWVNNHYALTVRSIPPQGFVRERVGRFVASQGQTINTSTTPVLSVVVLATGADGTPVREAWGTPSWH